MIHSIKQFHWVWPVWLIWFNSLDLPQLITFKTGRSSFLEVLFLHLTSLLDLIQFIRSSSINNILFRVRFILLHSLHHSLQFAHSLILIRCSFHKRHIQHSPGIFKRFQLYILLCHLFPHYLRFQYTFFHSSSHSFSTA